ncbi:uncharacterized protein LOC130015632 [Mercurialis annua]|uniref:uncharacterized protein LOC130015632 n=1 Tax=Mercurialis annua TaxID=3986 RepID=UPI0024AE44E8|nr:uncharacterized protein LOC130015632 [Mercurialis annua]
MLMHPLPTVKKAYAFLCEEEKQRGLAESKVVEQVHAINFKSTSNYKQFDSKYKGTKKNLHCTYCDGNTHTIDRCFYLNGFPVGHKLHGKDIKPPNRTQRGSANQVGVDAPTIDQTLQFTPEELSQIKAFFRNEKSNVSVNCTGPHYEEDDWPGETE